ncbi:SAM-dependent chlorinase/fluorinase [Thermoleophilia bacterium SCSIO 60948]|nr:SAM-dependent chlorinase/fluorinase [Thermoleophilia bacterium SCSIO 60948]
MAPLPITFLSDYGLEDEFAGVCHAVIARIVPDARIIDLTHEIRRHDIRQGAAVHARAITYAAPGVHLAVIDPGVGTSRRSIALRTAEQDRLLVGPDNGLLLPAARNFGGIAEAVDISYSDFRLDPVSSSFHGRDIFAPVTATLAQGASLREVGEPLDAAELEDLDVPAPRVGSRNIEAHVASVDRFGNLTLNVAGSELAGTGLRLGYPLCVDAGERSVEVHFARTFAEVEDGRLLVYVDSWGSLAIAVNRGDARRTLNLDVGDRVGLTPLPSPAIIHPR